MSQTRVYILGAGCSVCGGYPLAWEVRKALEDFAKDNLQVDETKELRRCVEKTCELMDQHGIQTTDQLAQALGEDRRAEIEESKKAMSALFFSLEDVAVEKAYSQYARLFEELFEQGESPLMEDRVMATNCRVLTYNYDRLFERAFIKWALPQAERSDANAISKAVEWLNSSLRNPSTAEFVPDRFALLKLHGGIGRFYRNRDYGLNHIYPFDFRKPLPKMADNPYFEIPDQKTNEQTIFYPTDKRTKIQRRAEETEGRSSLRDYENKVWDAAERICEAAREIQIIGYSMQPIDWWWFKNLIRAATKCERIVIRNRQPVTTQIVRKVERLREDLKADWKVESREEDFFEDSVKA